MCINTRAGAAAAAVPGLAAGITIAASSNLARVTTMAVNSPIPVAADLKPVAGIEIGFAEAGIKKPNMANPAHLWALRNAMAPYAGWMAGRYLTPNASPDLSRLPEPLRGHAAFACEALQDSSVEISGAMRKHQLKLADRQLRMAELSSRVQKMTIILCTALYAGKQTDETVRLAAAQICGDLRRCLTQRSRSGLASTSVGTPDSHFRARMRPTHLSERR